MPILNYNTIFSKGSNYVYEAGNNWAARKGRLITYWSRLYNETPSSVIIRNQSKAEILIYELEDRIKMLATKINEIEKEERFKKMEADEMIVFLSCPNFECRYGDDAVGVGIKYKNYVPDKLHCAKCGSVLKPNDLDIEETLIDMRIHTKS